MTTSIPKDRQKFVTPMLHALDAHLAELYAHRLSTVSDEVLSLAFTIQNLNIPPNNPPDYIIPLYLHVAYTLVENKDLVVPMVQQCSV